MTGFELNLNSKLQLKLDSELELSGWGRRGGGGGQEEGIRVESVA